MLGLEELEEELRDTDVFHVLNARRTAPTETDKLMHLVPYPEGVDVKNPLPEWRRLALSAKIPYIRSPKDYTVYKRGKLGEAVMREGDTFDLSDPYNYGLEMKYEPIHDKHLRNYFYSPGNKKILEDMDLLTREDEVKCKLSEYNAYRGYVYSVHKNSVIKAIREKENIEADKAEARRFMEAAAKLRENQRGREKRLKSSLRRAAQRRVVNVCQQLLCESRLKRLDQVKEKQDKQKEHEHLKLLVNQKNFHEQLKNYKIKSQEVNWQRNIRAQKKWKKVVENEEYRKLVTTQVDQLKKLNEVMEYWIRKELYQLKSREKKSKVYKDYCRFSRRRRSARDTCLRQMESASKTEEMWEAGGHRGELYKSMGEIYAGMKSIPPNMKTTVYETPILKGIMERTVCDDNKLYTKKYWSKNLMRSRVTSEMTERILQCVYIRAVKLYLRHAIFRQLPILLTELQHVIILFEEDMKRKNFSVDEIRRLVRSYVGQRKGEIFHSPEPLTSYAYLGRLKKKLFRSSCCHQGTEEGTCHCDFEEFCHCDSEMQLAQRESVVKFSPIVVSAFVDKDKKVSFTVGDQGPSKKALAKLQTTSGKQKSKKRPQLASILKQCPLKAKKTTGDHDNLCCSNLIEKEVCDCNTNVKKVSFIPLKLDTLAALRESSTEKTVKVSFDNKTKVIPIPLDSNLIEPPIYNNEGNKDNNFRYLVGRIEKNLTESEDTVTESETMGNIENQIRETGQKKLSFEDDEDRKIIQKPDYLEGKVAKELKSLSSEDLCTNMDIDIFKSIKTKFTKQDESKNVSGPINCSSSSTDLSSSENLLLEENNHKTVLDGGRRGLKNSNLTCDGGNKCIKELNGYDECKTPFKVAKSQRLVGLMNTDCTFPNRKKKLRNDQLKENLKIMFEKYITGGESSSGSLKGTCEKERNESHDYSSALQEQFLISEPFEEGNSALEEVDEKAAVDRLKSLTKSLVSFNDKDDLTNDKKRGTCIRDCPAKPPQTNLSEVPKDFGKCYLKQVFAPQYKPRYAKEKNGENSILVKSQYSPAENCILVPKYLKQYKFKDLDELKNFVELQVNIDEPEALAAVKTERGVCKELTKSNKINLDALSQYSKEVVPGGNEEYKNYIRNSRVEYNEQKKEVLESYDWEEDKEEMSMLGKTMSLSKLSTQAAPEVNRVFTEIFERDWPEVPQNDAKEYKADQRGTRRERGTREDCLLTKAFQTPEDVIQDSRTYKEHCRRCEIRFLKKYTTGEKKYSKVHGNTENLQTDKCSASSNCEFPKVSETHKFSFLQADLFKPDQIKLCEMCNTCPISVDGEYVREKNAANLLECAGCGACVHNLMDSYSESMSDFQCPQTSRQSQMKSQNPSPENSQQEITFLNDAELKEVIFRSHTKHLLAYADLRAIFGPDFDPDKFVYFVKDGRDHISWKDIIKRRYPLKPFPWNRTKLSRLQKRRLPISQIKDYSHPKYILRNKVAKGYEMWEKTKNLDLDGAKEELKCNKVPKKHEKLFSTTVTPANRPAKTLKSVRDRRPTPMPSTTDLLMHVIEESGGDLHCARRMVHDLRIQAGLIKCKVDTTVRVLVEAITVIAILKLKEGYPSLRNSLARTNTRFYYQPTGYHKYYGAHLARSLGEVLYSLEVKQYNFARLQPLADIIMKNLYHPGRYPLIFPESARDLIHEASSQSSDN